MTLPYKYIKLSDNRQCVCFIKVLPNKDWDLKHEIWVEFNPGTKEIVGITIDDLRKKKRGKSRKK